MSDHEKPDRYEIRREQVTRATLVERGMSPEEMRESVWPTVVRAYAIEADGTERRVIHHVLHSPLGFEFGYRGSGPHDLARCLLIDWFNGDDRAVATREPLPVSESRFVEHFLASLDRRRRNVTIRGSDIAAWVRSELAAT